MYRCIDCDAEFHRPEYRREHENHPEVEGPYREEWEVPLCPECGSEYIEEGEVCLWCGIRWASIDYCDDCISLMTEEATFLGKRYTHSYQETLDFIEAFLQRHW